MTERDTRQDTETATEEYDMTERRQTRHRDSNRRIGYDGERHQTRHRDSNRRIGYDGERHQTRHRDSNRIEYDGDTRQDTETATEDTEKVMERDRRIEFQTVVECMPRRIVRAVKREGGRENRQNLICK
jgi:hypothetical protein